MATVAFDLDPSGGPEQFSDPLTLAPGETAYARFTSLDYANELSFEIDANSAVTFEQVGENTVLVCTRIGPADIRLRVNFHPSADDNVTGILEGV